MWWLAWRQFRAQTMTAAAALAVVVVALASSRHHISTNYGEGGGGNLTGVYVWIRLLGTALIGVPAIVGAFWGAPLVARELENHTYRTAWTQSVTRSRWLAAKLMVIAFVTAVAVAVFAATFTWWAQPIDRTASRISPAQFAQRGVVPVGYAMFGLALGTLAGIVVRKTLPAMAASLAGFFVVRVLVQNVLRAHLASTSAVDVPLFGSAFDGSWVLSTRTVDAAGVSVARSGLESQLVTACHLTRDTPNVDQALSACAQNLGIRNIATAHPAHQFWTLQLAELGVFLAIAGLIMVTCFWWINRRLG